MNKGRTGGVKKRKQKGRRERKKAVRCKEMSAILSSAPSGDAGNPSYLQGFC